MHIVEYYSVRRRNYWLVLKCEWTWKILCQVKEARHSVIPFIYNVGKGQIHRHWKWISCCPGLGERVLGSDWEWLWYFLGEGVIKLLVIQFCDYTKNHWVRYFKKIDFMVCKLYLSTAFIKERGEGKMVTSPNYLLWDSWETWASLSWCDWWWW